jgi:hypothetical protein
VVATGKPGHALVPYLFNQLLKSSRGRAQPSSNRVTIVTFNFDRSFERALYLFVRANRAAGEAEAIEQLLQIPIYHLHGQLCRPDWLAPPAIGQPACGSRETESHVLRMCAEQMRIVDDEVTDNPTLGPALSALEDADAIAFLGFSFHPLNLQKLQIERLKSKLVRGTAYKLPVGPRSAVERTCESAGVSIVLTGPDDHVLTFLENTDLVHD